MPEFFNVLPPNEARRLLLSHIIPLTGVESISAVDALGRVTAQPVVASQELPTFKRSTMDGYALKAADTFGASDTLPAFLTVVAEVAMGKAAAISISKGQAVTVHTGGMIPDSADAVVMIEHTQRLDAAASDDPGASLKSPFEIEVFGAVAVGQNVIQVGEDIRSGDEILPARWLIRPQDIGGMLALGITEVNVAKQPVVGLIATGDEVVKPEEDPLPGQIRDINSYTIGALAAQAGAATTNYGIVSDDFQALLEIAQLAIDECDMVVISAGSSVSARDMTVDVVERLGAPGVLLHGVATRPGKPTILGAVNGKPVLGLPGNPVSAVVQFIMFGGPAVCRLVGMTKMPLRNSVKATLSKNVASETGREDYIPARLEDSQVGLLATPIFGKSNLIFTLVKADGLILIPLNEGGVQAGAPVDVILF